MLSAFPPTLFPDSLPFGPGFPSWEPGFLFPTPQETEPGFFSHDPVTSNTGSDPQHPTPSSGSDESNRNEPKTLNSGSDDQNRNDSLEDRKRRRKMSNRESARRSRMRKQKHLENLRSQANRLKLGNREQTNRLRLIIYQTQLFRRENECLRSEAAALRQRLWDTRQVLVVRQLQQLLNPMPMQNNHNIIYNSQLN